MIGYRLNILLDDVMEDDLDLDPFFTSDILSIIWDA